MDASPHSVNEQKVFTDGRIFASGGAVHKGPRKIADCILRYTRDFSLAVVEAKAEDISVGSGLQQAKEYAEILGLRFAYATNGREILEFDYLMGAENVLTTFPSPSELWARLKGATGLSAAALGKISPGTLGRISPVGSRDCAHDCARKIFHAKGLDWPEPAMPATGRCDSARSR